MPGAVATRHHLHLGNLISFITLSKYGECHPRVVGAVALGSYSDVQNQAGAQEFIGFESGHVSLRQGLNLSG